MNEFDDFFNEITDVAGEHFKTAKRLGYAALAVSALIALAVIGAVVFLLVHFFG